MIRQRDIYRGANAFLLGGIDQRSGEGVARWTFHKCQHCKHLFATMRLTDDIEMNKIKVAFGNCPGLVQHHLLHVTEGFQPSSALYDDASLSRRCEACGVSDWGTDC